MDLQCFKSVVLQSKCTIHRHFLGKGRQYLGRTSSCICGVEDRVHRVIDFGFLCLAQPSGWSTCSLVLAMGRPSGRVDLWLEPCVWCNPDPNRGLYSLNSLRSAVMLFKHILPESVKHFNFSP